MKVDLVKVMMLMMISMMTSVMMSMMVFMILMKKVMSLTSSMSVLFPQPLWPWSQVFATKLFLSHNQ